jgi:hypothetical protein
VVSEPVNRYLFSVEPQVQSSRICGELNGTGARFSLNTLAFPCQLWFHQYLLFSERITYVCDKPDQPAHYDNLYAVRKGAISELSLGCALCNEDDSN